MAEQYLVGGPMADGEVYFEMDDYRDEFLIKQIKWRRGRRYERDICWVYGSKAIALEVLNRFSKGGEFPPR